MSIAVIGQGFVGGSLTSVFAERGFTVYTYDKAGKTAQGSFDLSSTWSLKGMVDYAERVGPTKGHKFSGVYFVCVPTPMYEDGSADLSIVESVLEDLASIPGDRIAVVKSTVPPGSTDAWNKRYNQMGLHVVFNPEFLTEANAINDMREQNRIILGGPRPYINTVKNVFQRAFPKVPIIKTGSTTAEMVKYTTNCFLSVKVSFANEIAQVCEALDNNGLNIDYDKVIEYAKIDHRLGDSHWAVPGPVPTNDGRHVRGFGGHCFPKDINALMTVAKNLGVEPTVMNAAWQKNLEVRSPEDRDWELQIGRAVSKKSKI
jgi:UDPglucose 6-dehydrogenase